MTMRMLTVSLLLCAAMTAAARCPYGSNRWYGNCYRFERNKLPWALAERRCMGWGGHLASIRSSAEYRFVQRLISTKKWRSPETWIGGSDAQMNNVWLWSDGSPFRFTYWAGGEPNNVGGRENCIVMNHRSRNRHYQRRWNDLNCGWRYHSICKKRG